jgi:hypothetical protein
MTSTAQRSPMSSSAPAIEQRMPAKDLAFMRAHPNHFNN